MSKKKTATNSRTGGGKKKTAGTASAANAGQAGTSRRSTAAMSRKVKEGAKASGSPTKEKRHAGIRRG